MKPKEPNQGEGDRASARQYDDDLRTFIASGKVPGAARSARDYVEQDPEGAARAERKAKRGPRVSVDDLIAKGRTVMDRVRSAVDKFFDRNNKRK